MLLSLLPITNMRLLFIWRWDPQCYSELQLHSVNPRFSAFVRASPACMSVSLARELDLQEYLAQDYFYCSKVLASPKGISFSCWHQSSYHTSAASLGCTEANNDTHSWNKTSPKEMGSNYKTTIWHKSLSDSFKPQVFSSSQLSLKRLKATKLLMRRLFSISVLRQDTSCWIWLQSSFLKICVSYVLPIE